MMVDQEGQPRMRLFCPKHGTNLESLQSINRYSMYNTGEDDVLKKEDQL